MPHLRKAGVMHRLLARAIWLEAKVEHLCHFSRSHCQGIGLIGMKTKIMSHGAMAMATAKGREISERNCGVLKYSKKLIKFLPDFCPRGLTWIKSKKAHF